MMTPAMKSEFAIHISKDFFKTNPKGWVEKKVKTQEDGCWGIDVYGHYNDAKGEHKTQYLFNVNGSVGSKHEIGDDLHTLVNDIIQTAIVS